MPLQEKVSWRKTFRNLVKDYIYNTSYIKIFQKKIDQEGILVCSELPKLLNRSKNTWDNTFN